MEVETFTNSSAFKIVVDDKYAQPSDADAALKAACDRLRGVGLQVENESGNYVISQNDRVLHTATAADQSSYAGIAKLNELAEAVFFEGYLNANLCRLAALGWQAERKEIRTTPYMGPARTFLRVTVISGKSFDYPISLDGAYQLHRDLERAECRRALLGAMPKLEAKITHVTLADNSFSYRQGTIDFTCGYNFRDVNGVLEKAGESITVHTFKIPETWL